MSHSLPLLEKVSLHVPLGLIGVPPCALSFIDIDLSASFTCNVLYKINAINGNTLTSAPVSSFTVSLSWSSLTETSVSHAWDFLIP